MADHTHSPHSPPQQDGMAGLAARINEELGKDFPGARLTHGSPHPTPRAQPAMGGAGGGIGKAGGRGVLWGPPDLQAVRPVELLSEVTMTAMKLVSEAEELSALIVGDYPEQTTGQSDGIGPSGLLPQLALQAGVIQRQLSRLSAVLQHIRRQL